MREKERRSERKKGGRGRVRVRVERGSEEEWEKVEGKRR